MKQEVASGWTGAVLVCGKCSKKAGGGFGEDGRGRLAKLLRGVFGKGRRARVGVVETKCLGICPKRGVVVIDTADPGRWRIVAPGTPIPDVLEQIGRDQA